MPSRNMQWPGPAETFSMPSPYATDATSGDYEWGALAESKVTFLTHCPSNADFISRCHRSGVKCFPYITLSFGITEVAPSSSIVLQPSAPASVYQGVDFGSSAFWAINSKGAPVTRTPGDGIGVAAALSCWTCPNVEAYQQSMLNWVEKLMQSGADGLFIDAIPGSPSPCLSPCYADQPGPEFQQFHHEHIFGYNPADLTAATGAQQRAFSLLLERVRSIVRKYRGKVLGNTALPFQYTTNQGATITTFHFENLDPFIENGVLRFLDADMMEDFLDLSDFNPSAGLTVQHRWNGYWYPYIQAVLKVFNKREFRGKHVLVIPPNPLIARTVGQCLPPNVTSTVRSYQFLTYVAARLAGFIRFVGPLGCYADFKLTPPAGPPLTYQQAMQDQFGDLARLRLGPPITGILTDSSSNVFYRLFESGLVALNSDMSTSRPLIVSGPGNFQTPNPPFSTTKFLDLTDPIGTSGAWTHLEIIDVTKTSGALTIPPLSGRVYLFGAETSYLLA